MSALTKHHHVDVGWIPEEVELSASLVTRRDDADPANGPAVGTGSGASTLSLGTRRVYAGAWQAFFAWHRDQGERLELPVLPERIVAYIDSLPPSLGPNSLKLRMAAIADHHGERQVASPTAHAAVRAALRRRQTVGESVLARLGSCGEDLAGLRNRALLLLIQVGGLAPADVAGLDREDLRFGNRELVLSVRPAEAPAEQPGQAVRLARRRGDPLCPAQALERWLQRSGISYGAVFRAVSVHGTLERRLGVVGVRRILQQIDAQAAAQAMPEGRKPARGARPERHGRVESPQVRRFRQGAADQEAGACTLLAGEDSGKAVDAAVLAPVDTDWLRHTLTLSGPGADVAAFQIKARGPSAIPWHLDLDHEEMRLLVPMAAAGPSARGLARELRAQLVAHQERVLAAAE